MGKNKLSAADRKIKYIEAFIQNGGDQRNAALTAGCKNERAADQYAQRMLKDVEVRDEIQRRLAETLADAQIRTGITVERTLREVARLAYFDPKNCFDQDGNVKELHEMDEDTRAMFAPMEVEERFEGQGKDRRHVGYVKKMKVWDKNTALDKLMKHQGLYKEDNAQLPPVQPPVIHVYGVRAINGKPA